VTERPKEENPNIARLRRLVDGDTNSQIAEDDDLIGIIGEAGVSLDCKEVQAVCTHVSKPKLLSRWSSKDKPRFSIYFTFEVVEPYQHQGVQLMMYTRWNPAWAATGIDHRSKLYRCACLAAGSRLKSKGALSRSVFKGKLFRCQLKRVGQPPTDYSEIETILEKLTG
jgi:hypothetical protein